MCPLITFVVPDLLVPGPIHGAPASLIGRRARVVEISTRRGNLHHARCASRRDRNRRRLPGLSFNSGLLTPHRVKVTTFCTVIAALRIEPPCGEGRLGGAPRERHRLTLLASPADVPHPRRWNYLHIRKIIGDDKERRRVHASPPRMADHPLSWK